MAELLSPCFGQAHDRFRLALVAVPFLDYHLDWWGQHVNCVYGFRFHFVIYARKFNQSWCTWLHTQPFLVSREVVIILWSDGLWRRELLFYDSVSLALSIVRDLLILRIKGGYISQPSIDLMILVSGLIPEFIPPLLTVAASSSSEIDDMWIFLYLSGFDVL